MFLGHYGLSLVAKRATPSTSLGTLTFAGNLADCVWPILLLLGVERVSLVPGLMAASDFDFESYPWSHSLATGTAVGLTVGLGHFALRRDARAAAVVGAPAARASRPSQRIDQSSSSPPSSSPSLPPAPTQTKLEAELGSPPWYRAIFG